MNSRFLLFLFMLQGWFLQAQELESTTMTRNQIRAFLEETKNLYGDENKESHAEAAGRFKALQEQTPEGEMNLDALRLARGMSHLKAGDPDAALKALSEIEGFEDPVLRGQHRQMRGNAQMQLAEAAVSAEDWQNAESKMEAAVESFQNALRENPEEEASRINLELAQKRLQEIVEMKPPPPPQEDQNQQDQNEEKEQQPQDNEQRPQNQDPSQEQEKNQDSESAPENEPEQAGPQDQESQNGESSEQDSPDENPSSDQSGSDERPESAADGEPQERPGEPSGEEQLDARQAEQILDAALEQEKLQRRQLLQQRIQVVPVEKDW
ncbi:MAG: hypothetical protein ACO3NW_07210 [Kiritimatiellia bacterium]